jgi:hypothetical protein
MLTADGLAGSAALSPPSRPISSPDGSAVLARVAPVMQGPPGPRPAPAISPAWPSSWHMAAASGALPHPLRGHPVLPALAASPSGDSPASPRRIPGSVLSLPLVELPSLPPVELPSLPASSLPSEPGRAGLMQALACRSRRVCPPAVEPVGQPAGLEHAVPVASSGAGGSLAPGRAAVPRARTAPHGGRGARGAPWLRAGLVPVVVAHGSQVGPTHCPLSPAGPRAGHRPACRGPGASGCDSEPAHESAERTPIRGPIGFRQSPTTSARRGRGESPAHHPRRGRPLVALFGGGDEIGQRRFHPPDRPESIRRIAHRVDFLDQE